MIFWIIHPTLCFYILGGGQFSEEPPRVILPMGSHLHKEKRAAAQCSLLAEIFPVVFLYHKSLQNQELLNSDMDVLYFLKSSIIVFGQWQIENCCFWTKDKYLILDWWPKSFKIKATYWKKDHKSFRCILWFNHRQKIFLYNMHIYHKS